MEDQVDTRDKLLGYYLQYLTQQGENMGTKEAIPAV